jgi:hypothetical protein
MPLSVGCGGGRFGAAGVGCDVSLSYVTSSQSFARRKPRFDPNFEPSPRRDVVVTLAGRAIEMIPRGNEWVARRDAPAMVLREIPEGWILDDGEGVRYRFTQPVGMIVPGLWYLTTVSSHGAANHLELAYEVPPPGADWTAELESLTYNFHPTEQCAKHRVSFTYGQVTPRPLAVSIVHGQRRFRHRTLARVDLEARESCQTSDYVKLRHFAFGYTPDVDTGMPRLTSVDLFGRAGTAEDAPIRITTYGYGRVTNDINQLAFAPGTTTGFPGGQNAIALSQDATGLPTPGPDDDPPEAVWQNLVDMTGDGRPDFVDREPGTNRLRIAVNRPGAGGTTFFAPPVQLTNAHFMEGPLTLRSFRHSAPGADGGLAGGFDLDMEWRQLLDFNGDGRMDIVDAGKLADRWVVYLNRPGNTPSGIDWVGLELDVTILRQRLEALGYVIPEGRVPLGRRQTSRNRTLTECVEFTESGWLHRDDGDWCQFTTPDPHAWVGEEITHEQFGLRDINGDGYPDFVFNTSPIRPKIGFEARPSLPVIWPPSPPPIGWKHFGWVRVKPQFLHDNEVKVLFNVMGPRLTDGVVGVAGFPFSGPKLLLADSVNGLARWAGAEGLADPNGIQLLMADFLDVNGDGLVDRVGGSLARLGDGEGTFAHDLTLPGVISVENKRQFCSSGGVLTVAANQLGGLRDLTGDGIPDFVNGKKLHVGTGVGFGTARDIVIQGGGQFFFSTQQEACDGSLSITDQGVYDLDGDGVPEVLVLDPVNGLAVFHVMGSGGAGAPDGGRLNRVDDPHGARTTIIYVSAKRDALTAHAVPSPEIVVSQVQTEGRHGLSGPIAAVKYAYGDARLVYDPARDGFVFPGYGRTVTLVGTGHTNPRHGIATISETWGLAPSAPAMSKEERFARYQRVGRARAHHTLAGDVGTDAWSLLAIDTTTDSRRRAGGTTDWGVKSFAETPSSGVAARDCADWIDPYDPLVSLFDSLTPNSSAFCGQRGFAHLDTSYAWRGDAAPPAADNIETRTRVMGVDDFGNVTHVWNQNDLHDPTDDKCSEALYAQPLGVEGAYRGKAYERSTTTCERHTTGAPVKALARERWHYDLLPLGMVTKAWPTAHLVERRTGDDGTLIDTVRVVDATFDPTSGVTTTLRNQRDDGAEQTETLTHDPFHLVLIAKSSKSTGFPAVETEIELDPVSLQIESTLDAHGVRTGQTYDGLGRPIQSTMTPPQGTLGVLSTVDYVGFGGGATTGRQVITRRLREPAAPANAATAPAIVTTQYLDELGRERATKAEPGEGYETLLTYTTYDTLGRAAFVSDPYPVSENAAAAYGTSFYFNVDGTPLASIRGRGPQPLEVGVNESLERYATVFRERYFDHRREHRVWAPDAQLAGSPQQGVYHSTVSSASGRVRERGMRSASGVPSTRPPTTTTTPGTRARARATSIR